MTLGGAARPPRERVGLLQLAAARARLLHRSGDATYQFVALLVALDAARRLDAAVALVAAFDLELVGADDPRAAAADEARVAPLAALVAVLKEIGLLLLRLRQQGQLVVVDDELLCLAVLLLLLRVADAAVG